MGDASEKNEILEAWESVRKTQPDALALWSPTGGGERTFSDIEREAGEWGQRLAEFPVGSVIALQISNHPAWPALLLACFRTGMIPLPVPTEVRPEGYAFCGARARWIRGADELRLEPLANPPVDWPDCRPDFLKLTSGTTSRPRAVRFTAKQLAADCQNICVTMGLTSSDLNYGVIPFAHSYGFSNLLLPLLTRGIPLVVASDPFPRAILAGLAATQATVLPGIPSFYAAWLQMPDAELPSSLRLCLSAGSPLPAETARRFHEAFGQPIHSFYGSSECGGICYDRIGVAQAGWVGEALAGVSVTVDESVQVTSDAVALGYFPADDALRDGVFRPADILERGDGGWRIVGRVQDFINLDGRKVNPEQIEECLRLMPGMVDCVVFGIERVGGMRIGALVVCDSEPEAIRKHCARHLPAWQVPRQVFCESHIPRNERGKINRRDLAATYSPS